MKKPKRVLPWIVLLCVFALLGVARSFGPAKDISAGTGYAAWDLCTRTMQSGEPLELVRTRYVEPKVQPLPRIWSVGYKAGEQVEVHTVLPTLQHPRTAIFREGRGCTLVPPGTRVESLRAQPFRAAADPALDAESNARAWPFGEGAVEAQLLSADTRASIERHASIIFGDASREPKQRVNSTALLVARDGHLVFERYGDHVREQPQLGWSMTKTLTGMVAGLLVGDGKITLDGHVGLPQWKGTPKEAITWRQLLNMAPGLEWNEGYGGASDATEMLFSQGDQGAWAADRPLSSKPGTVFTYSTGFTNIAMQRMRQLLGGEHQAIYDYYQSRLFAPLGIRHGVIEPDASGTPVGGARGMLRPVDWLRLGQLMANGGVWNGSAILPAEHVAFMTAASPASAGYGGSMWREASDMLAPELRKRLPDDLVWFAGHLGQYVIVVPSKNLVVLRMGVAHGGSMQRDPARSQVFDLVADLLQAS